MDLTGLFQTSYQRVGNTLSIQYYRRIGSSSFAAAVAVDGAFENAVERDEGVFAGEQLANASTVFHLWRDKLAGLVPRANDVIEQGGVRWMITAVRNCDRGSNGPERYRCECTKERP